MKTGSVDPSFREGGRYGAIVDGKFSGSAFGMITVLSAALLSVGT